MRSVLTLLLAFNLTSGFCQQADFTIKGKLVSCSTYKDKPSGFIYLYKDSRIIDSVNTYRSTPDLLGGWAWTSSRFKFKGLSNGKYEIRYKSYFDLQDFPTVEINNFTIKNLEICFDKLPERLYTDKTFLDDLKNNDTLFIDVYIAAGGEFGGYDEGFWITKFENKIYGRFYSLPNTYALHRDTSKVIETYSEKRNQITSLTADILLSELDLKAIKRFLIEITHYHDDSLSNAPEHFYIFTKHDLIYRIKNNSHYQPYLNLRDKIKTGLQQ